MYSPASNINLLIALSDILDGYFARLFDSITDIGKFLDPFADKVCVLVFILFLSIHIPGYFVLFIFVVVNFVAGRLKNNSKSELV